MYGGQIVAQALRAAASTVDAISTSTSLRAYFIRRGDHAEPVRYEVDRIRNGRSFSTRRVVARQAVGAILNLEASFQRDEESADVEAVVMPTIPGPDELEESSWSTDFERRFVPEAATPPGGPNGTGRIMAWIRVTLPLPDPATTRAAAPLLAGLPVRRPAVRRRRARPPATGRAGGRRGPVHGQPRPHDLVPPHPARRRVAPLRRSTHHFVGGRGLTIGHVFDADGVLLATFAQEALLRERSG